MSGIPGQSVVDVHCHLLDSSFDLDRLDVIRRAQAQHVIAVIEGAQNLEESKRMLRERDSFWRATAGIHPDFVRTESPSPCLEFIKRNADRLVAVAEIGLDYYRAKSEEERQIQRSHFCSLARLATQLDLPVVVHSRGAGKEAIRLLREWGTKKAVLHAFDGRAVAALEGARAGYFFSVPPSIVRSQQKRKLVQALPIQAIMLESDSPVLGPTSDERNEPSNIWVAARAIAEVKHIDLEEVARTTTDSATVLFGLSSR